MVWKDNATDSLKHKSQHTIICVPIGASQVALALKNLPGNAGDVGDIGSIPGLAR